MQTDSLQIQFHILHLQTINLLQTDSLQAHTRSIQMQLRTLQKSTDNILLIYYKVYYKIQFC